MNGWETASAIAAFELATIALDLPRRVINRIWLVHIEYIVPGVESRATHFTLPVTACTLFVRPERMSAINIKVARVDAYLVRLFAS